MPSLHCFFLFGVVCDFQVQPVPAVCAAAWQGDSSLPSRKEPERCSSNSLGGGERGHRMGPGCTLSASVDACFFFDVFSYIWRFLSQAFTHWWHCVRNVASSYFGKRTWRTTWRWMWAALSGLPAMVLQQTKVFFLKLTNTHVLKTQAWHLSIFLLMLSACRLEVPSGHAVLEPGCAEEWSSVVFVFIALCEFWTWLSNPGPGQNALHLWELKTNPWSSSIASPQYITDIDLHSTSTFLLNSGAFGREGLAKAPWLQWLRSREKVLEPGTQDLFANSLPDPNYRVIFIFSLVSSPSSIIIRYMFQLKHVYIYIYTSHMYIFIYHLEIYMYS